jgi:hypothetical protein
MSSVVVSFPESLDGSVSDWIRDQALALKADLEAAGSAPSDVFMLDARTRMLSWCGRLKTPAGSHAGRHFQRVIQLGVKGGPLREVLKQSLEALPTLTDGLKPNGCPDWIDEGLIERTLGVFQPRYTELDLVLLTPQDAVDMICGMSALTEWMG